MIEKWESPEALESHGGTDHIRAFVEFDGYASAPRVLILEPTGAGEAEKGTL